MPGGDFDEALTYLTRAVKLSPNDPHLEHATSGLAYLHHLMGNFDAALAWANKSQKLVPANVHMLAVKAASLGQLGRTEEASDVMRKYLEQVPHMTVARLRKRLFWKRSGDVEHFLDGMRKAGLPE